MKYLINLLKYKFIYKIDDNLVVFTSFNGKYADSPKILTEYIHKLNNKLTLVWLVNDINNSEIPDYVLKIKYGTNEAWKYYSKAKIIIDNVYCMHEYYLENNTLYSKIKYKIGSFLKNKKGKLFYTTWHGTPLKKIGIDAVNNNFIDISCPNTKLILDNKYTENIMKRITENKIETIILGAPRNDLLFDKNIDIENIKKELNLPIDKKIILFAPSFREKNTSTKNVEMSGINQINSMDINLLLDKLKHKFGDEWIIVCRFHYHVEKLINWSELNKKYNNKIFNGNEYEDISKYLKCSDILLTDMSSTLFDFSLLRKPVFLYFPDKDNYINNERGIYFELESLPFSFATNFKELLLNIKKYDSIEYNKKVKDLIDKLGYSELKPCSNKIAKFILEDAYGKKNDL